MQRHGSVDVPKAVASDGDGRIMLSSHVQAQQQQQNHDSEDAAHDADINVERKNDAISADSDDKIGKSETDHARSMFASIQQLQTTAHEQQQQDDVDSDSNDDEDVAAAAIASIAPAPRSTVGRRVKSASVSYYSSNTSRSGSSSNSRSGSGSTTSSSGGIATRSLEELHEELELELAPRKLLRQFSLTIIPPSTSGFRTSDVHLTSNNVAPTPSDASSVSSSDFRSAVLTRNCVQHASPNALGDVLARWEKNHVKWRDDALDRKSNSPSQASTSSQHRPLVSHSSSSDNSVDSRQGSGGSSDTNVLAPLAPFASLSVAPPQRTETIDVTFTDGFLGIEFVVDELRGDVVVKSVQPGGNALATTASIVRGLVVDAIAQHDANALAPEDVLEMLQFAPRPLAVRFRKPGTSVVVCKLCECRVDALSLEEHTTFCIQTKQIELEADQLNNQLSKLATSIVANLQAEELRATFDVDDLHFYNALRVVAIQASSCDVTSVESFALCSRLLKIVDRIRQQEPATLTRQREHSATTAAGARGLKYCSRLRALIDSKMRKMRATQKVLLLQQAPSDALFHSRAPFSRTKSLEENEPAATRAAAASAVAAAGSALHQQHLHQQQQRRPSACRVSIEDFQIVKPISKGAYGKVYLARKKTTGDQYAIKVLAKQHLLRKKQQLESIEIERDILVNIQSPYVVKLFWTFQSRRNLFLVMEYLPGGDFMSLLECIVQLEEQVARVYIAEIALALNHLHSKGCVHRDLKPDNILISSTGHIKLTDFGLSEEAMSLSDSESDAGATDDGLFDDLSDDDDDDSEHDALENDLHDALDASQQQQQVPRRSSRRQQRRKKKKRTSLLRENSSHNSNSNSNHTPNDSNGSQHAYGRCGTPDYLSPEIILGIPHGPPVDYWALGIIMYEMLVGFPPFNDDTVEAIFHNILERQILWPDGEKCLSADAIDLISKLLEPDQTLRLDWPALQRHRFFDGIDWETLLDSIPPFVPTLEGPTDTSYFNNRNLTDVSIDDNDDDDPDADMYANRNDDAIDGGNSAADGAAADDNAASDAQSLVSNDDVGAIPAGSTASAALATSASNDSNSSSNNETMADSMNTTTYRFPSGMYSSTPDVSCDASSSADVQEMFSGFSLTNMNALAAASLTEADLITDTRFLDGDNASALSILI